MRVLFEFQNVSIGQRPSAEKEEASWGIGPLSGEIPQGSFLLVAGPIASGKSSLLACLVPELARAIQSTGIILYEGCSLEEPRAGQTSAQEEIAYLPQQVDLHLVSSDVWQELAFALENRGIEPEIIRMRVAEVAHCLGLQDIINKDMDSLSGGQRQLVALASVLVTHPKILILDEPGSQLDPLAREQLFMRIAQLNREQGLTVICASHTPEELIHYCTHILKTDSHPLKIVPVDKRANSSFANHCEESSWRAQLKDLRTKQSSSALDSRLQTKDSSDKQPLLKTSHLYFSYGQDKPWVIKDCSLTLNEGECLTLVGQTASGKSSLLMLLAGGLRPLQGDIVRVRSFLSAQDKISCASRKRQAYNRVVLLPQDPRLLFACESVFEELMEWSALWDYKSDAVEHVLDVLALKPHKHLHPLDLSGGQQQILALYKLLLTKPDIILFDEPTSALDRRSQLVLAQEIGKIKAQGKGCVVATHDLSFAALVSDSIGLLFDGSLSSLTSPEIFFEENYFLQPNALVLEEYNTLLEAL